MRLAAAGQDRVALGRRERVGEQLLEAGFTTGGRPNLGTAPGRCEVSLPEKAASGEDHLPLTVTVSNSSAVSGDATSPWTVGPTTIAGGECVSARPGRYISMMSLLTCS